MKCLIYFWVEILLTLYLEELETRDYEEETETFVGADEIFDNFDEETYDNHVIDTVSKELKSNFDWVIEFLLSGGVGVGGCSCNGTLGSVIQTRINEVKCLC